MPDYYSPTGNIEVWEEKPAGYFDTLEDLYIAHPELAPTPQTPDEAKASKLQEINNAYTASISVAKIGVPEDEILTWDIQRLEALAWEKDPTVATPFLAGLLAKRNEARALHGLEAMTLDQLLAKTLEKVKAYEMLTEQMTGKRQGLEDSIKEATTIEQINAITWEVSE